LSDESRHLSDAIKSVGGGRLVVVTGAGISLASGIPTFRGSDPDAVWKKDVTELGTRRYFEEDPVGSWKWYTSRFDVVLDKQPNAAHLALSRIETWQTARGGEFLLVTQNVDTLHELAKTKNLIKVHGSSDQVRCSRPGCSNAAPSGTLNRSDVGVDAFVSNPSHDTLPRCPDCDSLLRQHVLWFDEYYDEHDTYQWQSVLDASANMDMVLFVGTSFAVGVTELFLRGAITQRVPAYSIDPGTDSAPHSNVVAVKAKSEIVLPEVCEQLGA